MEMAGPCPSQPVCRPRNSMQLVLDQPCFGPPCMYLVQKRKLRETGAPQMGAVAEWL